MKQLMMTLVAAGLSLATAVRADPADCTAADYASAVERSAEQLREASRTFQPKLQERMRRFQQLKGLSETEYEAAALAAIDDKKISDLDAKSSELLLKIDGLGRIPAGRSPNCAEISDIERLSKDLLSAIKAKSDYMIARLDSEIAAAEPKTKSVSKPEQKSDTETGREAVAPPPGEAQHEPADAQKTWSTATTANDAYVPPPGEAAAGDAGADGYTIEEVQEATRGFFGTISTSLASVIEHAFKTSGRPTAYVLGTEGGGAFLAGLRFGEGKLYMRHGGDVSKVWWHGPSVGGDIGATGARTMFLIYRLPDRNALFRSFTGVDGSAFFVGGVGMTVLKGGDVIMAPIRTGLGFRLGANIGYVRFTNQQTWNPF